MKFFLGIGQYRLDIHQAESLKDKRQVMRRIIDRISNIKMAGAAEVGENDYWKSGELAVVVASTSHEVARGVLDKARSVVEDSGVEVLEERRWIVTPEDIEG